MHLFTRKRVLASALAGVACFAAAAFSFPFDVLVIGLCIGVAAEMDFA